MGGLESGRLKVGARKQFQCERNGRSNVEYGINFGDGKDFGEQIVQAGQYHFTADVLNGAVQTQQLTDAIRVDLGDLGKIQDQLALTFFNDLVLNGMPQFVMRT